MLTNWLEYFKGINKFVIQYHIVFIVFKLNFVMLIITDSMSRPEVVWEKTWKLLAEDVEQIERKKRNHPGIK